MITGGRVTTTLHLFVVVFCTLCWSGPFSFSGIAASHRWGLWVLVGTCEMDMIELQNGDLFSLHWVFCCCVLWLRCFFCNICIYMFRMIDSSRNGGLSRLQGPQGLLGVSSPPLLGYQSLRFQDGSIIWKCFTCLKKYPKVLGCFRFWGWTQPRWVQQINDPKAPAFHVGSNDQEPSHLFRHHSSPVTRS